MMRESKIESGKELLRAKNCAASMWIFERGTLVTEYIQYPGCIQGEM
jgi:hypothetical protein